MEARLQGLGHNTAALVLLTILPGAMFSNGWLTMKLLLLPVYVVLGSFAALAG